MTNWVPQDQVEPLPAERENPLDLLEQGKLGRAIDLRRALTHVRLTGRLADVIYSMETTNTDFYPYQFKPVLRFLQSPSNALLIADEVGLGKTIEAGLIWTELRSRFDLRRLVVLCPAMLRDKWRRELRNRFGIRAEVENASGILRCLKDTATQADGFAAICSLEGARPPTGWEDTDADGSDVELARYLRANENHQSLVDLVIIDEAHYLRNPESQTNELGRLFRRVTEYLLLLTATPIHNQNQDLFSLLHLLDADTFQRPDDLVSILNASRPLVEARDHLIAASPSSDFLLARLRDAERHPLMSGNRQLESIRERISPEVLQDRDVRAELAMQLEMVNPRAYVITRTRKREVKEWRVVRQPECEYVPMAPAEAMFYSAVTETVIDYAMSRDVNDRFVLSTPQRQMSSSMAATLRAWQRGRDNLEDDAKDNAPRKRRTDEIGPLKRHFLERAYELGSADELATQDSKYARLLRVLGDYFHRHPNDKIVLFSTFRETLNYLGERLAADGFTNLIMHGGVKRKKDDIIEQFRDDPNIRALLSSEVGSEGIDLQFCRVVINYDLPWNPMRVEQRIGRLDRIGQQAERILIWSLLSEGTIDARIYARLYEKLDLCRQALGDFEPVLADAMRELTIDLLSDHLTPRQQEARIDQTAQAMANLRREHEHLEEEASHLVAYGDYILRQVQSAREMKRWITGDDIQRYVIDFCSMHYPGCRFQEDSAVLGRFEISLSPEAKQHLEDFVKSFRLSTTQLTQSVNRPIQVVFENRVVSPLGQTVEAISQFHPLVRFVAHVLNERAEQLTPAVVVQLPADTHDDYRLEPGDYLLAGSRWTFEGLQVIERLAYAASTLDGNRMLDAAHTERLANACAKHSNDWLEGGRIIDLASAAKIADEILIADLDARFRAFADENVRRNEDRADLQLRNLHRHRDTQRGQLETIRNNHRFRGRESLVKATEGRLHAMEDRVERQESKIASRRKTRVRNDCIFIAVVKVY